MTLQRPALTEAAIAAADLDDFGGDEWEEGLDRLVHALETEADLSELGRTVAEHQIVSALTTRLRVIGWHATHPEVTATPVAPPIVIVGQPRTGTTILFDLLAQDPAFRAPLTWEVSDPIPPPQTATYGSDARIAEAEAAAAMSEAVIPGFQAIHPTGALRGQECVAILAADFRSLQWPTVFRVPSYGHWLIHEADHRSAYRYHRQFLQVLQSEHPGERWLLKTPAHQWHLGALFAEYPDATIIHTHRDPLKVLASVSSLMGVLRKLATDQPSVPDIASEWIDYLVEGNERSIDDRESGVVPPGQAIDLRFSDLMADTIGSIAGIYAQIGRELTSETAAAMEAFLADNGREKHGTHRYTFAETELDLAATRQRTARYEQAFDVGQEIRSADD